MRLARYTENLWISPTRPNSPSRALSFSLEHELSLSSPFLVVVLVTDLDSLR
uniref:Uncharacterized protein n=2 Tax=Brassica oleracea TaxID=3712 RepID=A0A0D2ZXC3_BRAOL|nr:unnamed protein product [Brassica oleracea]